MLLKAASSAREPCGPLGREARLPADRDNDNPPCSAVPREFVARFQVAVLFGLEVQRIGAMHRSIDCRQLFRQPAAKPALRSMIAAVRYPALFHFFHLPRALLLGDRLSRDDGLDRLAAAVVRDETIGEDALVHILGPRPGPAAEPAVLQAREED